LYFATLNEIEFVRTGPSDASAIIATTAEESTPPDRNAPRGTSLIIRMRVASLSRPSRSSTIRLSDAPERGWKIRSQ
jgi:hypothetical protein